MTGKQWATALTSALLCTACAKPPAIASPLTQTACQYMYYAGAVLGKHDAYSCLSPALLEVETELQGAQCYIKGYIDGYSVEFVHPDTQKQCATLGF